MAVQPRDPNKAQTQPDKKKTETVLLSADELRRLSGGVASPSQPTSPSPTPKTDGITSGG